MPKTNKTNKKNSSRQMAYLYPKLKQRQRFLHTIKAMIRLFNLALFGSFIYGFYLLWNLDFWNIKNIEYNGLSKEGYAYISKFNIEKELTGHNIILVNPSKIKNIIGNISFFKTVNIYRSIFPTILSVNFVEREPYLSIHDDASGEDLIIDDEGIILNHIKKSDKKKKIIYFLKKTNNLRISSEQLNLIKVIENFRKKKIISDLGTFDITNHQNIILTTSENRILLGNIESFVMKMKAIPALEVLSKEHKNKLEYIDVRYSGNHVLKLKKGSDTYEKIEKEHTD